MRLSRLPDDEPSSLRRLTWDIQSVSGQLREREELWLAILGRVVVLLKDIVLRVQCSIM